MENDEWSVDLKTLKGVHSSGFTLELEGKPSDPSAVNPGKFPKHLSGLEQVRLLRQGVEAFAKASAREKQIEAKQLRKPASRVKPSSSRPVLSLKRKFSPQAEEA